MLGLLDRFFVFAASLKLAVMVILAIAVVLGVATFYEARYGMAPVQARVYGSSLFLGLLAVLAINVMAAALIRYPWKRKQTGFVITHLGILVLLAGCLISFRTSVDGRISLNPGDSASDIAKFSERIQLTLAGRTHLLPGEYWAQAGYPSAWRALMPGWPEPRWRGETVRFDLGGGVGVEVLEWLPAARPADDPADGFVPARVAANKLAEAQRAVRLAVTVDGVRRETWVVRGAHPTGLDSPRGVVSLAYGYEAHDLPFTLALIDARRTTFAGTDDSASFESDVVVGFPNGTKHRQTITMNQPLTVGNLVSGYTFYQSGFAEPPPNAPNARVVSTLAVRYDPGTVPKYLGSALICLGIFLMFYMKAYFQKGNHGGTETRRKQAPAEESPQLPQLVAARRGSFAELHGRALCLCVLLAVLLPGVAMAQELRSLPVLDQGRVKPLDTLARETARLLTGRERFRGIEPLDLLISLHRESAAWEQRPLLHVPLIALRQTLGLPEGVQHASPAVVRQSAPLRALVAAAADAERQAAVHREQVVLTREQRAAVELAQRAQLFDRIASGEHFALLPASSEPNAPWLTLRTAPADVATAFQAAIGPNATPADVETLRAALSQAAGPAYYDRSLLDREVAYHRLQPFRWAWGAYLLATLCLCLSRLNVGRWAYGTGIGLLMGGIVWSAVAFAWRCSITGWAPVTNIYETVIWVALTGAITAMAIELVHWRKTGTAPFYPALAGALAATAAGLVADLMPPEYGAAVVTLAPVLQSNFWLTVHVLTIVSSYAAFLVALVLGNILLYQFAFARRTPRATIDLNLKHLYRSLQVGVLLIFAGTVLGGLWADVSWGRFWAWDPKEVWALIILLVYLALLHGRYAGWVGPWGLAMGSVLAFLTVLMSWYGVNFVLGAGLHTYGFGTGGQAYVGGFTLLQLAYVGVCTLGRRRQDAAPAGTAAVQIP